MKTIKEHINQLQQPYRIQAINNTPVKVLNKECEDIFQAIADAFIWTDSPQGNRYWINVLNQVEKGNKKYII